MPIELMKALGSLVITGSLTYMQAVASGIILGFVLLVTVFFRWLNYLEEKIIHLPLRSSIRAFIYTGNELGKAGAKTDSWVATLLAGIVSIFTNIVIEF